MDTDSKTFATDVIEASSHVPVLVDFWAPWCGPCRSLGPVLERVVAEYGDRVRLVKVNSDANPELSERYAIRSIPSVKAFVDGQVVDEFLGAQPETAIRTFIDGLLPSPAELLRREGRAACDAGRIDEAVATLSQARSMEPRSAAIGLDLAEALAAGGREGDAAEIVTALTRDPSLDATAQQRLARLAVRLASAGAEDIDTLAAKLDAAPEDLDVRLRLAQRLVGEGQHEAGLEHYLELVRRGRRVGDDAGRKGMLQTFALLGQDHPLVPRYRKLLAATLN